MPRPPRRPTYAAASTGCSTRWPATAWAYVEQAHLPAGWLRVLIDERLCPALTLLHAEPGRPWDLAELARTAAMSRTSFAEHFRAVAGMPPLAHLSRWRMLLAQCALRARSATRFKRKVGESPLRYRRRLREEASRVT